jgi:predicted lipid-binding transport protein (Tim44 family)
MDASSIFTSRRLRRTLVVAVAVGGVSALTSASADASSRQTILASTSNSNGVVLIALGGGVLLLGVIGFFLFTWSRRKRRPSQCEEQREALAQAEKAVQYWEAARAHLEAVARARSTAEASSDSSHASLVAKAVDGLSAAMKQRDQCQMDLIHCMASGAPGLHVVAPTPVEPQPFFIPGTDGTRPS